MNGRKRAAGPNAENNAESRSDQQTLQLRPAQPSAGNIYEGQSASQAARRLPRQLIDVASRAVRAGKDARLFCGRHSDGATQCVRWNGTSGAVTDVSVL